MKRRILSIITALALCLSLCPTWALAAEADPSLCRHHPKHTEDCGYTAPTEGHDCGHRHTAECYTKGVLPDADGGDYYEIGGDTENLLNCQHSHNSECGYVQADPGTPCGYVCRICPIEDLIAALPEQVTADNAADVRGQLDHILDLYRELNEDEQEEINLTRIYALQGALDAANDPDPIAESVNYQEASWNGGVTYTTKTADSCTPVTDSMTAWNAGWYVVNSTVTISEPITVTGAVNLILADGCTLDAQKGIVVETGNSLTIYAQSGSGTLNATGTTDSSNNASAGIGGSTSSFDSGTITIHGGAINATGGSTDSIGYGGAGIGGGTPNYGNGGSSGAITIYGGTVTANSGEGGLTGAGIGGGGGEEGGTSSNITIYGGSVTAASIDTSTGGAGIGGGSGFTRGGGDSNIQIHGGTVNATGGYMGAGIGGGADSAGTSGNGTVTISGGTVTAVGGQYAAGIGGGGGYSTQYSSCTGGAGSVTISGGIVDATGGAGNSSGNYAGDPIGNGGNTTATATVNKTTGIVFENSAGTVCGAVTLDGSYTVPGDYTLNIPVGASLSGSGTLSGGSAFTTENLTEDMISVPEDWHYTGEDRTADIETKLSGELDKGVTICGQTFMVSGWTLAVEKAADSDLTYTAIYTNNSDNTKTVQKTITLLQSGTDLTDGKVKTYKDGAECSDFTAGDTIKVVAAPTPTGEAPTNSAMFAASFTAPGAGQMAVFVNDIQVSEPVNAVDGTYTMTVSAADVLLAAGGPGTGITLTAKFVENNNMADGQGTATVSISAAAKAERGGALLGYYDESGLVAALANSGNEGAVFTLLDNMERETDLKINISCTLDLNGKTIRSKGEYVPTLSTYIGTAVTIRGEGTVISEQGHGFSVGGTTTLEGGTFISGAADCGGVYVQAGKLIVTGEAVVIENTGGGTGLGVGYNAEAQLSGGTYSSIWVDSPHTLAGLLNQEGASRVAYYKDNATLVTEGLDGKELTGTVTVKACTHTGEGVCTYTHNENTSTHTKTCLACGNTWEAEDCDYGEYTHNDTSHTRICKLCEYQNVEAHNIECTAEASGTVIAVSEACKTCGYGKDLGTVTIHIPKLVYGNLTGVVTAETTLTETVVVAVVVDNNSSGSTVIFPFDPPTMATLTGNALLSAGTHQIKIEIIIDRDDDNELADCLLPFTVDPAPLTADMVTLGQTDVTYKGTEQKPALSVKQGETPLTEGTDYEVSYTRDGVVTNDFTSAGTVNITVTAKGNYTGSVEKTYTIGKATPKIEWANSQVELTYTGQPADIKPVITLVNGEEYKGEIHYSWGVVADSLVPPTDAQNVSIMASIPEQGNYLAAESGWLILYINKANQDAPDAPTADGENIKDTSITLNTIENAEYSKDGTTWQDSPAFTGLDPNRAYTFYARLKEDRNHNASPSSAGTSITTRKAMLENASVTITGTYTYTGASIVPEAGNVEVVLNGTKIDSDQYTISASNNINAGVGKATLTVTATETGNYSGSVSSTFTIAPATLTIKANDQTITYGGSITQGTGQVTSEGLCGGDTLESVTLEASSDQVAVADKTITPSAAVIKRGGEDAAANYNITYQPGALTINKSQPTIAFAEDYNPSKTYDGQTIPNPVEANLTITGAAFRDVTFAWSATPRDAGTYTLTANIKETPNTAAASTSPLTVTISKATLTATGATVASKTYDTTKTATVSGVTFTGLVNGETLALGTDYTASGEFDSENAGTGKSVTVTVTLTSDKAKNYNLAQNTTTATGTINRASSTITTAPTATGITYGEALRDSTLTGGEGSVAGAFSWTAPATKPNAGTAQYEVTFTPTDTNYDTATVNVSVTVAKATPTLTAPTAGAIQYGQKLSDSTLTGGTATNPNDSATVAGSWSWANGNTQPTATGTFPVAFVPSDTANYNTPENVDTSVTVNPAEPKITLTVPAYQIAGGEVKVTCTVENPHDAAFTEGIPETVTLTCKVGDGAEQTLTGTSFTIPEGTAKDTVITATASTAAVDGKYTAATKTANVTVTDKIPVEISGVGVTGRAYNGKAIDHTGTPVIKTLDGKTVTDATVTYTWSSSGDTGPINAGNYTLTISVDGEKYIGSTTVDFTIEKATVTITATNKSAVVGSAQPELTYTMSGLADGETLTTAPTLTCTPDMNTVGSYPITASGAAVPNTGNYNTTITYVDGTLSVTAKPSTGGGGYVPSNPGGSTLPVTTTGQGSSTVTTTTTAAPTTSVSNGTATTTINTAMGQEIVRQATANKSENVVIAPSVTGNVTKAEVSIPASTVGQIGSQTNASLTVSTPVADVTIPNGGLGSLSSAGGTVTVTAEQVGNSVELTVTAGGRTVQNVPGGVTLTVPAANTTPGTVAVLVHPDGTREVVRKSVADNGAVTIPLDGSAKLEIVDNSKYFADVPATSWAADAVAFASAHELFGGTGANQFSPDLPMSRGMLAVVLHNLESNPAQALTGAFADVDNSQWYAEGVAWAEAQGIIGGYGNGRFGPNDNITREQLAVMLWRYSGSPAATDRELHFADAHRASDWALDALRWATENGIINGKGGGILDPTGQATRAEAAQMLKNFMEDR